VIELDPLVADDLPLVAGWLREPHVACWWLQGTTAEVELQKLRARVAETRDQAMRLLVIRERSEQQRDVAVPVGWCQWYPYDAYPAEAEAVGAHAGDCGIDYAIGDPAAVARGLGTQLLAVLVDEVRRHHPGCGLIADPDARNAASRRVLERNGFSLTAVRVTTAANEPVAIYRLAGPPR
jgi:aminoglycoside 6'-N-acetyltransferase